MPLAFLALNNWFGAGDTQAFIFSDVLSLNQELLASRPSKFFPAIAVRIPLPEDVRQILLARFDAGAGSEGT